MRSVESSVTAQARGIRSRGLCRLAVAVCGLCSLPLALRGQAVAVTYRVTRTLPPNLRAHLASEPARLLELEAAIRNSTCEFELQARGDSVACVLRGLAADVDTTQERWRIGVSDFYVNLARDSLTVTPSLAPGEACTTRPLPSAADWRVRADRTAVVAGVAVVRADHREREGVTAWFAPAIPVAAGPEGFGGLPGLILALDDETGGTHYEATAVTASASRPQPPWYACTRTLDREAWSAFLMSRDDLRL